MQSLFNIALKALTLKNHVEFLKRDKEVLTRLGLCCKNYDLIHKCSECGNICPNGQQHGTCININYLLIYAVKRDNYMLAYRLLCWGANEKFAHYFRRPLSNLKPLLPKKELTPKDIKQLAYEHFHSDSELITVFEVFRKSRNINDCLEFFYKKNIEFEIYFARLYVYSKTFYRKSWYWFCIFMAVKHSMEHALKKITKTYIPTFYNKTTLPLVLFLSACFYENVEWMKNFFYKANKKIQQKMLSYGMEWAATHGKVRTFVCCYTLGGTASLKMYQKAYQNERYMIMALCSYLGNIQINNPWDSLNPYMMVQNKEKFLPLKFSEETQYFYI
ncbi:MGF_300-4L protein [African swine fever virus]|uniref:MGF_300-4L protein n=1 Tax=African swine fever virus TaxID=10497 RepID=A0A7D5FHM6_ASF|nr:MGF_300-4L protein [African swine fever virus]